MRSISRPIVPPLNDNERRVAEAMSAAGQLVPETPTLATSEVRNLRARLMLEEVLEYIAGAGLRVMLTEEAIEEGRVRTCKRSLVIDDDPEGTVSMREMIDGAADCDVVVTGTFLAHGIRQTPFQEAVSSNNLSKMARATIVDGKYTKHPDHQPPDIDLLLRLQGWSGD